MTRTRKSAVPRTAKAPKRFVLELTPAARDFINCRASGERPRTSANALVEYWLEALASGEAEIVFPEKHQAAA